MTFASAVDRYGIFIGRMQPLHHGHELMIKSILKDGRIPLVFIGSSNVINEKNPFTYQERVWMIKEVAPHALTFPLRDYPDDDDKWLQQIIDTVDDLNIQHSACEVFVHQKPGDNNPIPVLLSKVYGLHVPDDNLGLFPNLHATNIRNEPLANIKYVPEKIAMSVLNRLLQIQRHEAA